MKVILFVCFVWLLVYFGQMLASDALLMMAGFTVSVVIVWLREYTKKESDQ